MSSPRMCSAGGSCRPTSRSVPPSATPTPASPPPCCSPRTGSAGGSRIQAGRRRATHPPEREPGRAAVRHGKRRAHARAHRGAALSPPLCALRVAQQPDAARRPPRPPLWAAQPQPRGLSARVREPHDPHRLSQHAFLRGRGDDAERPHDRARRVRPLAAEPAAKEPGHVLDRLHDVLQRRPHTDVPTGGPDAPHAGHPVGADRPRRHHDDQPHHHADRLQRGAGIARRGGTAGRRERLDDPLQDLSAALVAGRRRDDPLLRRRPLELVLPRDGVSANARALSAAARSPGDPHLEQRPEHDDRRLERRRICHRRNDQVRDDHRRDRPDPARLPIPAAVLREGRDDRSDQRVSAALLRAVGDGLADDTRALQAAIDETARRGGGTVRIPAGRYVTGSLVLRDDITLHLEAGSVLLGSLDPAAYPLVEARWEGRHQVTHAPLVGGKGLRNVASTRRGTIDGRGAPWWAKHRQKALEHPRPRLISFSDSSNILVEGITATNSPAWTINPVRCENVAVRNVTIFNPPDSPNTDGINPDSCRDVRISDCHIDVGDDCITLKSGIETEDPDKRGPCENIAISNCTMAHGHGGVVIGSETSGDVRNVVIANCIFTGTERGIRIKTRRGRGGVVEDVRATNIIMRDVLVPFTMNLYYNAHAKGDAVVADRGPRPVDEGTPRVRRIRFGEITARDAHYAAAFLWGLPEMPIEDVAFSDVTDVMSEDAREGIPEHADGLEPMRRAGFFARNMRGLRLDRVDISGQAGEPFLLRDVT